MLGGPDGEANVAQAGPTSALLRLRDRCAVRIQAFDARGQPGDSDREATIAAPEVEHPLAADEPFAAPIPELIQGSGAESRRDRRDVPSNVANQSRITFAQAAEQLSV